MNKYSILYVIILTGFISGTENPVTIKLEQIEKARAGEVLSVPIKVKMDPEYFIYSIYKTSQGPLPTSINLTGQAIETVGQVIEPDPKYKWDKGFETNSYYHTDGSVFRIPIKLKKSIDPGQHPIKISVFYQVCNDRLCYPPTTKTISGIINVDPGSARSEKTILSNLEKEKKISKPVNSENTFLSIFLLAIGGAILSWIMPCVYPMIPIIISFFGKLSEEKHIGRKTVASIYGIGIAGTFFVIGLTIGIFSWGVNDIASKTRYANIGNFIATNAWINLFLGILFIFFALWMFGIININVSGRLLNKTDQAGQSAKSAYFGSLLLGVAFAITSFSCTVPVVGALLVIATSGTTSGLITSLFGMTVYGVVFALPFIGLSLFPTVLNRLPRSGVWMETVKITFGFVELAAAVKFLWVPDLEWNLNILERDVVLSVFVLIGFAQIAYLLGIFSFFKNGAISKPFNVGLGRYVGTILTFIAITPLVLSLLSEPTYHYKNLPRFVDEIIEAMVPPSISEDEIAVAEGWFIDDYERALEKARYEGKPLFIDFTGVYCANCRIMERRVFPQKLVKKQFKNMILSRLYVDKKDSLSKRYAEMQFKKYKQATQPYYVVIDPIDEFTLADTGGYMPKGFDIFLKNGIIAFEERKKSRGGELIDKF